MIVHAYAQITSCHQFDPLAPEWMDRYSPWSSIPPKGSKSPSRTSTPAGDTEQIARDMTMRLVSCPKSAASFEHPSTASGLCSRRKFASHQPQPATLDWHQVMISTPRGERTHISLKVEMIAIAIESRISFVSTEGTIDCVAFSHSALREMTAGCQQQSSMFATSHTHRPTRSLASA